jgi:hypothetical protein
MITAECQCRLLDFAQKWAELRALSGSAVGLAVLAVQRTKKSVVMAISQWTNRYGAESWDDRSDEISSV